MKIEFRYYRAPQTEGGTTTQIKKITIGVYDTFDEACINGNGLLETLEGRFELHQFPDGRNAPKQRFSADGGCFGGRKTLITNLAYLKTPFEFYVTIETLKYGSINASIDDVISSMEGYIAYRKAVDD